MALSSFLSLNLSADRASGDHAHDALEIVCADACDGAVWFGDAKHPYRSGDLFIHPPRSRHRAWNRVAGRHLCLGLTGPEIEVLRESVVHGDEALVRLFRGMADELSARRSFFRPVMEAMAQEILFRILRAQEGLQPAARARSATGKRAAVRTGASAAPAKLEVLKKRLEEAPGGRVDLEALSGELLLSPDYLRHAFKKEYGVSPMQFLIQRRIENAKKLLDATNLKAREIAERCGFENEFYFSRLFRQVAGVPPTAWRARRVRGGEERR